MQNGTYEGTRAALAAAGRAQPWSTRQSTLLWRGGTNSVNLDNSKPRKKILRKLQRGKFQAFLRVRLEAKRLLRCASNTRMQAKAVQIQRTPSGAPSPMQS